MNIQTLGFVTKEEHLRSIEDGIVPDTCVLESNAPFPGYHGSNWPEDGAPEFLYIVFNTKYAAEKIFRIVKDMRHSLEIDVDGVPGKISIYTETYYCLRVRALNDYNLLIKVQDYLILSGLELMKKKKIDAVGITRIQKMYELEAINDKAFKDLNDDNIYYLTIPKKLNWGQFRSLTMLVKNNLDTINFDIALSVFYAGDVIDALRVYSDTISQDELLAIQAKYLEFLTHSNSYITHSHLE